MNNWEEILKVIQIPKVNLNVKDLKPTKEDDECIKKFERFITNLRGSMFQRVTFQPKYVDDDVAFCLMLENLNQFVKSEMREVDYENFMRAEKQSSGWTENIIFPTFSKEFNDEYSINFMRRVMRGPYGPYWDIYFTIQGRGAGDYVIFRCIVSLHSAGYPSKQDDKEMDEFTRIVERYA